jgi:hypothetical protein
MYGPAATPWPSGRAQRAVVRLRNNTRSSAIGFPTKAPVGGSGPSIRCGCRDGVSLLAPFAVRVRPRGKCRTTRCVPRVCSSLALGRIGLFGRFERKHADVRTYPRRPWLRRCRGRGVRLRPLGDAPPVTALPPTGRIDVRSHTPKPRGIGPILEA